MDVVTVLLSLAALLVLALVGTAVFLMIQKRSIDRAAAERADALVAENMDGGTTLGNISKIKEDDAEDVRKAA